MYDPSQGTSNKGHDLVTAITKVIQDTLINKPDVDLPDPVASQDSNNSAQYAAPAGQTICFNVI
jgi:hypothetical protein